METKKLINKVISNKEITEKEILLLKRRLNSRKISIKDIAPVYDKKIKLTPEQTSKGFDWLMNCWKTPLGKERKNNPFGYREQKILETFKFFTFKGFYDAGNYYISHYEPLYNVVGDTGIFQYYVTANKPQIIA